MCFCKNINPTHKSSTFMTKNLPKPHLLLSSHPALRIQHMNFGGTQHSDRMDDVFSSRENSICPLKGSREGDRLDPSRIEVNGLWVVVLLRYNLSSFYPSLWNSLPGVTTQDQLCYLVSHFPWEAFTPISICATSREGCKLCFFLCFQFAFCLL